MILRLDFKSGTPLYLQLRNQIVLGIGRGELRAGEELPTVRGLAREAGINAMTAEKAYALLREEGYIVTNGRRGAAVAGLADPKALPAQDAEAALPELEQRLELLVAEAVRHGVGKSDFIAACERVFGRMKGLEPSGG